MSSEALRKDYIVRFLDTDGKYLFAHFTNNLYEELRTIKYACDNEIQIKANTENLEYDDCDITIEYYELVVGDDTGYTGIDVYVIVL